MGFWGVTLENGKRYSQTVDTSFHVSMAALECLAALEPAEKKKTVSVMVEHQKVEYLLCTLNYQNQMQQPLDLNFLEGEQVAFFINGTGTVHLTGYLLDASESMDEMEESDEDEEDLEEAASLKRKGEFVTEKQAKKMKKEVKRVQAASFFDDDDASTVDDEETDDEMFVQPTAKAKKTPNKTPQKLGEVNVTPFPKNKGGKREKIASTPTNQQTKQKTNASPGEAKTPPTVTNGLNTSVEGSKKKKKRKKNKNKSLLQSPEAEANKSLSQTPKTPKTPKLQNEKKTPAKQSLPGGTNTEDITKGSGPVALPGKFVHLNYVGKLANNQVFDSSKGKPLKFRLGRGEVVKGMDLGVEGMKVGGKRKIVIPSHQGYGNKKMGPIPANSTLVFEVELKAVS